MDWEAFYNHFREPDFIPGYEIQNRLGGGAFGEVYKARKHSIGKPYAIKFLKIDDETQREAVERELEQVRHFAAIDHPNLVTIEDMGTVLDVPYLIMGYAGEDTLARRLRDRKLEPRSALLFFVQACRGVLALHDRRLVHFDLKPSNIFIKGDIARVGDYGLSKLMVDGRMTLSFGRGTPHYMAPEMIKSRADHRADIYSLGVILFESASGRVPFEGETPGALVLRDHDEPPEFPADFPPHLREVVERCLHISPEDRYAGVAELLVDLGQTARPGDSVTFERVEVSDETPGGARRAARVGASDLKTRAAAKAKELSQGKEEIRQTAAELARGAVEVARSVWDGIRTGTTAGTGAAQAAQEAAGQIGRTAEPPGGLSERATAIVEAAEQAKREHARNSGGVGFEDVKGGAEPAQEPTPFPMYTLTGENLGGGPVANMNSAAAAAQASGGPGTIPVPPRVHGGVLGTLVAVFVLAIEVLVSLVTGLLRYVVKGFGQAGNSLRRSTGSVVGRMFRLLVLLFFLAVVGAGITLMAALFLTGGRL